MTRRAWRLIVGGYLVLSVAWLFGAGWTYLHQLTLRHNQRDIREETFRLALAASSFCEALRQPDDAAEAAILARLEKGQAIVISPGCRSIARRLLASRPETVP